MHCLKHWNVAANAGSWELLETLMKTFRDKQMTKEDLDQTLRAFQASTGEMVSKERRDYLKYRNRTKGW